MILGREPVGEPCLGRRQLMDPETLGPPWKQERQRTHSRPHPILVADHRDALKRRRVTGTRAGISRHRITLHVESLRSQGVEQPAL